MGAAAASAVARSCHPAAGSSSACEPILRLARSRHPEWWLVTGAPASLPGAIVLPRSAYCCCWRKRSHHLHLQLLLRRRIPAAAASDAAAVCVGVRRTGTATAVAAASGWAAWPGWRDPGWWAMNSGSEGSCSG